MLLGVTKLATTRNERRRRWFLRTWATAGWLAQWRAAVRDTHAAAPLSAVANRSPRDQQWARFAADSRVPSGVFLEVQRRDTGVTVTLPLTDPYLIIGNSRRCGLRLGDPLLRGEQYAFFWLHGELYGVDLRRNDPHHFVETNFDGWWTDGQSLRLGQHTVRVRGLPGIPARTNLLVDDATASLHLETPTGPHQLPLIRWLTLIGCGVDNGVFINETAIAPRQAALIRTPTSLWLVNLTEALPPQINHRPIEWSLLDPLDEFTFGATKAHVVTTWPEPASAISTEFLSTMESTTESPSLEEYRDRVATLQAELDRLRNLSDVVR